jgi:hypothetical protein
MMDGSAVEGRDQRLGFSEGDGGDEWPLSMSRSLSDDVLGDWAPLMTNFAVLCVRTRLT